jgi:MscS family membrane protein
MDVLNQEIIGNELWRWFAYSLVVVASLMVSKSVTYVFRKVFPKLTAKTSFQADDLVLDVIRRPVSQMVLLSGLYFGLHLFSVDDGISVAELAAVSGVYFFVITIVLVYMIASLYGEILSHYLTPVVERTETKLDDQLLPIAIKGGRFVIWSLGLIIAFSNAGIDVTSLIAGMGIGGLALAMAANDTVSNMFGGASIFADRPFEIGDEISVKGVSGKVEEIGIRTTRIRTYEDTIYIIPNKAVADSPVENLSARRKRKRILSLGLTYDTTYEQIQEAKILINKILDDIGGIEADPTLRLDDFGDSALLLKVIFWVVDTGEYWGKVAEINEAILKEFGDAGLEFAFPTQTLHVKQLSS